MSNQEFPSQADTVQLAVGWIDEIDSPSKRELLELILAEQRKTNELLTALGCTGVSVKTARLLVEAADHAVRTVAAAKAQSPAQPE